MEDDEYAIPGRADVKLIAVAAELEGGAEGLQRVLMGVLRGATVTDDVNASAALGDALVPAPGFRGRLGGDGWRIGGSARGVLVALALPRPP
jgi:hypothetical protein